MSNHTPGPWEWLNYPDGRKLLAAPKCGVIHCPHPMAVTDADQALIAAAPELLAACEMALRLETIHTPLADQLKAAIAKAKGE